MRVQNTFFNGQPSGAGTENIPARDLISTSDCWDLSPLYAHPDDWEAELSSLDALTEPIMALRGQISSPARLVELFEAETILDRALERMYTYAHLQADEDTGNTEAQARYSRIQASYTEISVRMAWILPEILSHDTAELDQWMKHELLHPYRHELVKIRRRKEHTLSEPEEALLSGAGELFAAPSRIFNFLTNADMQFPPVTTPDGRESPLSEGRYIRFLLHPDRTVRQSAFEQLFDGYGQLKNTLSATLSTNVKVHNYEARVRHHASSLEAALSEDNVTRSLYTGLLEGVSNAHESYRHYLDMRRRALQLDSLQPYDLYVPMVPDCDLEIPFDQAFAWVEAACAPLGAEYVQTLRRALDERWIDRYENKGKRSGAYSSGCYDSYPYLLLNYQGTMDDVFTLAHELGHSMHTHLANTHQSHRFAGYPIFIAEIASTLNEALLLEHLLKELPDSKHQAYLLNHQCDAFKGTVFRQTLFADFELRIHDADKQGQPLTADWLSDTYYRLVTAQAGPVLQADARLGLEWTRIPHFYYNFYVYKYATSFCAAQQFKEQVLSGPDGRDRYLNLLCAGGSDDPMKLVAQAGVDLTGPETYSSAFSIFSDTVTHLQELLNALPLT